MAIGLRVDECQLDKDQQGLRLSLDFFEALCLRAECGCIDRNFASSQYKRSISELHVFDVNHSISTAIIIRYQVNDLQ